MINWMRRSLLVAMLLCWIAAPGWGLAEEMGQQLFQSLKCTMCHKPDRKGAGPNLQTIAQAYDQQKEQLIQYLIGAADARMNIGKPKLMVGPRAKMQKRAPEEISMLADYLLEFKP